MQTTNPVLRNLEIRAGIHFMGVAAQMQLPEVAHDYALAMDAQPGLITTSNSGIPAFLSTYVDPKLIEVLVSPMRAAEVVGDEAKKGDWTMQTAMFPMIESTGETTAYGDHSEAGRAGVNVNFPQRQSFHYQVMTNWGERELEIAGLGKIDYANRLNIASVLTLNKYQNKTYFFGVSGLQNYGLLNDPALSTPLTPATKAATGTGWTNATGLEVYADIQALFTQLQTQMNGAIDLTSEMTLGISPTSEVALTKVTTYNVSVADMVKKNFPNLKVKTAPEYATTGGQVAQLILDTHEGQRTASCAFTEKLRAHPIVIGASNFKQKKSQGSWGTIIYRPVGISQMLGL